MFEITESMVMEDLSGARDVMKKLNRLGVRLAIDDFGTGHSSLAYLKQFPVHEVKVDRAFVRGVAESRRRLWRSSGPSSSSPTPSAYPRWPKASRPWTR